MILTKTEKEIYNLLDLSYRKDLNLIKISKHNTETHEMAKCKICYFLKQTNRKFITEAIFKNGKRADVLDLTFGVAYEVYHSETEKSLQIKADSYPIKIIPIKASEILKLNLEQLYKLLN